MPFTKLGKVTMYVNKDATEDNKQPHFKGRLEVTSKIPSGANIGLAGWLNEKGGDKSLFFSLSAHDDELGDDKEDDLFTE